MGWKRARIVQSSVEIHSGCKQDIKSCHARTTRTCTACTQLQPGCSNVRCAGTLRLRHSTFCSYHHYHYHYHYHYYYILLLCHCLTPASQHAVSEFVTSRQRHCFYQVATFSFRLQAWLPHIRTHHHTSARRATNQAAHRAGQSLSTCRGPKDGTFCFSSGQRIEGRWRSSPVHGACPSLPSALSRRCNSSRPKITPPGPYSGQRQQRIRAKLPSSTHNKHLPSPGASSCPSACLALQPSPLCCGQRHSTARPLSPHALGHPFPVTRST